MFNAQYSIPGLRSSLVVLSGIYALAMIAIHSFVSLKMSEPCSRLYPFDNELQCRFALF
jgi:hypothetical protein